MITVNRPNLTTDCAVICRNLSISFGKKNVLRAISLEARKGEYLSIVGPSGCGKTTLLRIIGGFETPESGELQIAGAAALGIPPHKRPVNTVFQSYALFPHMSVYENVAFGPRMHKVAAAEIAGRVRRALDLTRIADLKDRLPGNLSGGQQQRVALARALVNEPLVLLLDEPLGALDLKLRQELQEELLRLQRRVEITFIHVTHDQEEALRMSDRLAVMNEGAILQIGAPEEVYKKPANRFVAGFLGACNVIDGCTCVEPRLAETPLGKFIIDSDAAGTFALGIRPEVVRITSPGSSSDGVNFVPGVVSERRYCGATVRYFVKCFESTVQAETSISSAASDLAIGDRVVLEFPSDCLRVLAS